MWRALAATVTKLRWAWRKLDPEVLGSTWWLYIDRNKATYTFALIEVSRHEINREDGHSRRMRRTYVDECTAVDYESWSPIAERFNVMSDADFAALVETGYLHRLA